MYWLAMYFSVTTITTVGYGDMSAKNTPERILNIVTMILGVIAFSYATGALSSLIQDDDQKKAPYQSTMATLRKLDSEVKMDPQLLREISKFIEIQTDNEKEERARLLDEMPARLRERLSIYIYAKIK